MQSKKLQDPFATQLTHTQIYHAYPGNQVLMPSALACEVSTTYYVCISITYYCTFGNHSKTFSQ